MFSSCYICADQCAILLYYFFGVRELSQLERLHFENAFSKSNIFSESARATYILVCVIFFSYINCNKII